MSTHWRSSSFRLAIALSVLVVLTVGGVAPSEVSSEEQHEAPTEAPVAASIEEVDLGSGRTVADVEMLPLRGSNTKTFTTDTLGVWRTMVSEEPVHYLDGSSWVPIDTSLIQEGQSWVNGANSFDLRIEDGSMPGVEIALDETASVSWDLPIVAEASAVVDGTSMLRLTSGGTSVEVTSRPRGVKEVIVFAAAPSSNVLRFPFDVEGVNSAVVEGNRVELRDPSGALRAVIPPGYATDSSVDIETGEPAYTNAVTYGIEGSAEALELVMTIDEQWLNAAERVYPVRVDPTVDVGGEGVYDDTYLVAYGSATRSDEGVLKAGLSYVGTRTMLRFPVQESIEAIGYDIGAVDVLDSTMSLYLEAGSCVTDKPLQLRPVLAEWPADIDDTDWGWTSANSGDPLTDVAESCDSTSITVDGDGLAQQVETWIDDTSENHGLMLRATTENQSNEFKRFRSSEHGTEADRPVLGFTWTYRSQHLKIRGEDSTDTEFTSFDTSGPDCYPETGAPSEWGVECKLDLYWATGTTPTKAIVLVHEGGFLLEYANLQSRRQSPTMRMIADALAQHGYLVVVIDYRQGAREYAIDFAEWVPQLQTGENDKSYKNLLNLFGDYFYCTQRWEPDGQTPFVWPPDDDWIPDSGQSALPDECDHLDGDWEYGGNPYEFGFDEIDDVLGAASLDAVDDVQAAVAYIRTDPNDVLDTAGIALDEVFLLGRSAGAVAVFGANYDPGSTVANSMNVDGTVVSAGTHVIDSLEIDDDSRSMLAAPAPLRYLQYEFDGTGISRPDLVNGGGGTGVFDFARLSSRHLRDEGHTTELRVRCGGGHIAEPLVPDEFNRFLGETLDFFDDLSESTPVEPDDSMWFGATTSNYFDEYIGQDLVEDRPGSSRFAHRVGDFNGDGFDDIVWYASEATEGCGTVWYSQGDGSFAHTDNEFVSGTGTFGNNNFAAEAFSPDAVSVGDFDGDGNDDLFWYQAGGTEDDSVWYGEGDPFADDLPVTGAFCRTATSGSDCDTTVDLDGTFTTVAVGDFDGDGNDDLFFHDDTDGDVEVWHGTSTQGTFDVDTISGAPYDGHDVLVGDFNNDTRSDIYFPDPSSSNEDEELWYGTTTRGTFTELTFNYDFAYDAAVVGRFDNNSYSDIFFYSAGSGTDKVFAGASGTSTGFTARSESSSLTGSYELNTGYFTNSCCEGIVFKHSATGNEHYYRPRGMYDSGTGTTFLHHDLGDLHDSTRTLVPGQYGTSPGGTTGRTDILWHHNDERAEEGEGTNGEWWWFGFDPEY